MWREARGGRAVLRNWWLEWLVSGEGVKEAKGEGGDGRTAKINGEKN
jgi:hypothetical protein